MEYRQVKVRGVKKDQFTLEPEESPIWAQLIWLWQISPPSVGYNRARMTEDQRALVDKFFSKVNYPVNFQEILKAKTGQ